MLIWLIHYFTSGLQEKVSAMPMSIFRLAVAVAALWKCFFEWRRGAWRWFSAQSFISYEYRQAGHRIPMSARLFRVWLILKTAASALLLIGLYAGIAAVCLAVCLAFELTYERKFSTTYLTLSCIILAMSDGGAACLTYHTVRSATDIGLMPTLDQERALRSDALGQVLGVELTFGMYIGSAYRKALTPAFVSGTVLYRWIEHTASVEIQPPSRGVWRPSSPLRRLHSSDVEAARGLWHVAALATIVLEIAIPCGLLFSSTWLAVAFVGVGMHIVFTALYPVKLVPFSLSTVGSYALFLPLMSGPWLHLG